MFRRFASLTGLSSTSKSIAFDGDARRNAIAPNTGTTRISTTHRAFAPRLSLLLTSATSATLQQIATAIVSATSTKGLWKMLAAVTRAAVDHRPSVGASPDWDEA